MKNTKKLIISSLIVCLIGLTYLIVLSIIREGVHDFEDNCETCHINIPKGEKGERLIFVKGITQICLDCHDRRNVASHPVDIRPSMKVPEDLHLDWEGHMTCATCHDIHQKRRRALFGEGRYFLRRIETGKALCYSCHDKMLEKGHKASLDTAHMGPKYREMDIRGELDEVSFQCLRCHDGSIAMSARTEIRIGIWDHGREGGSHPVGVEYPRGPASFKDYVDIMRLPSKIKLIDGKVGCVTCHDPYSKEKGHLVMSNKGSALCLVCHKR